MRKQVLVILVEQVGSAVAQRIKVLRDNRLIGPKSPHRRPGLALRCRLVASWGVESLPRVGLFAHQAVRELGLRETVARQFGPYLPWALEN